MQIWFLCSENYTSECATTVDEGTLQEALQVQNIHTQCNLNKKHRIQPKILLYNCTVHMEKSSFCVDNHACHKEHAVCSWRTEQVVYSTQEGLQTEKKQTQCSRRFCSSSNLHSKLNPCRTNGQMRGQVATCCKSYVLQSFFKWRWVAPR